MRGEAAIEQQHALVGTVVFYLEQLQHQPQPQQHEQQPEQQ